MATEAEHRTLNVGVIGLGTAARAMIPVLSKQPGVALAAGAELDAEIRERFRADFDARVYERGEDLIDRDDVEAVYIATPSPLHVPLAKRALAAGKHVLVEKPMALNLDEADDLIEEADRQHVCLMEDEQNSFDPPIRRASEILSAGTIGSPRMINAWHYAGWLYSIRMPEELKPGPEWGGGVLMRQGPHQLNIIRTLGASKVHSVRGSVGIWDEQRPVVGMYSAWIEFESGAVATAAYSGYDRFQSAVLNYNAQTEDEREYARARKSRRGSTGDEGAQKRDQRYGGPSPRTGAGEPRPSSFGWLASGMIVVSCEGGDLRITPTGLVIYGEDERERIDLPLDETGRDEIVRQFYAAAAYGETPKHDARWSKATLAVCLAVQRSADENREIIVGL